MMFISGNFMIWLSVLWLRKYTEMQKKICFYVDLSYILQRQFEISHAFQTDYTTR